MSTTNIQPAMLIRYSYEKVPTIRRFALSNKRWRGLMGPFGSGKSSGCLMEIIRRSLMQRPSRKDGIRKSRWAIVRNCYSEDTEILTEKKGWVLFKDLEEDDKVAQYTPYKNRLEFVKPTYYYKSEYKGEMVGIKSQNLDLLVTPDHRLYVSKRYSRKKLWTGYHFEFAKDCFGKETCKFQITAEQEGEDIYNKDMMEFFGFWFAEGYVGKYERNDSNGYHYRLVLTQKKYKDYVRKLLNRNNLEFNEQIRDNGTVNFVIRVNERTKAIIERLLESGSSKEKRIPEWIKCHSPEKLKAFIRGFQFGDGSFKTNTKTTNRLWTSSKQLADDLQEVCLRAGIPAVVNKRKRDEYFVTILTEKRSNPTPKKNNWYIEQYEGIIYCVEVPTHIILVRRNGKAVLCSQTYPQLRDTTIKTVLDWLPPSKFGQYKVADHDYIITAFPDTRIELMFRALDKPEHVSNLLSLELTGAWINEAREVPKEIIDAIDGRISRYPSMREGGPTWCGIIMDTNPPTEDSWWYKLFEEDRPAHCELFKQPSGFSEDAENILTWEEWEKVKSGNVSDDEIIAGLPPDYYINLAEGKDPDYVKVYIEGNYGTVKEGKPVYEKTWNESLHLAKLDLRPVFGKELVIGMDFGLNQAAVITQLTPSGQFIVLEELISEGVGTEQFVKTLLKPHLIAYYPGFTSVVIGDPAGAQRAQTDEKTSFDILKEHGFKVRPAKSNSLAYRIGAVEHFLTKLVDGKPAFLLSQKCVKLRQGFSNRYCYRRIRVSGERYTETPDKNEYSHPHDALQYAATYFYEGNTITKNNKVPYINRKPASRISGY
ncbi:MAG: LAGLIDADG family homing endonuclease [Candidatus Caldatribacteriota bacterium]